MTSTPSPQASSEPAKRTLGATITAWLIALALVVAAAVTGLHVANARSNPAATKSAVVFVSPHPDDEFQMWSLVEDRANEYKIFVNLTLGEQTGFCEPEKFQTAFQPELGEAPPNPLPAGKSTKACTEARIGSLLAYLSGMSQTDSTVPGDFSEPVAHGPYPAPETEICAAVGDQQICDDSVRQVRVWKDTQDRGAVVFFNLGDGDLTSAETAWAVQTLIQHRADWGLAPDLDIRAVVGAFANDGSSPCFAYPHPDHLAVHDALWNVDFGVGPQLGATCYLDPRQKMSAIVSKESSDASFALGSNGERLGAHGIYYGWLHGDAYPLSRYSQSTLFHRLQSFWVRFN